MPTPQWRTLVDDYGFDGNAAPPWFMVPHTPQGGWKEILLDFGHGKSVKSINPRIADITDGGMDGQSRVFQVKGKSQGRTRIEVRNPQTNALESTLEVSVKRRRNLRIAFHFVEDKAGEKTVRSPDIVEGLIDDLNSIHDAQTNITFNEGSGGDVKIDMFLTDVVVDEVDTDDPNKLTMEGRLIGRRTWDTIFARKNDRFADFNVYFVPTSTPANQNLNILPYTDIWGNCVIEDGRAGLDIILPHSVGRMLGCPITTDDKRQLMYFDFNMRRSGNFIPKTCANIINPS